MNDSARRRQALKREAAEEEPRRNVAVGLALAAATGVVLAAALLSIPREHAPLPAIARYALEISLPKWGLTEPVNEIVYGTRGFDTFGETFLLLAAVISVIALTRRREARLGYFGEERAGLRERETIEPAPEEDASEREAREAEQAETEDGGEQGASAPWRGRPETPDATPLGAPGPERAEAMTVVVRTAVRLAAPVLAVAGFYLAAWGYSPGGGFPAGAVIVGVVLLVYAAFGRARIARVVRPETLETIEMGGAALIIGTELLGLVLRGSFSANWLPLAPPQTIRSGGVVQLFSVGELVEVGTGLAIVIFSLLGVGHDWASDEDDDASRSGGGGK
jgi:multicomponent Na+:H+ antiporter subunit B